MAFNGSGTFARLYTWVTDKANAINVKADRMDAEMDGFATGLTNTICRDGQSTITANIPFNNKKITGLADASSDTDALNRQTADARYTRNAADLTAETTFADSDVLPFYDVSASGNKKITALNAVIDFMSKAATAGYSSFPAGTAMLFRQTAAPTGWTKVTTYNDAALRVTSGTVSQSIFAGNEFTTLLSSSRTIAANQLPNMTLTDTFAVSTSVTLTSNTNVVRDTGSGVSNGTGSSGMSTATIGASASSSISGTAKIDNTSRGGVAQQAMNFGVNFVDVIIATKN